MVRCAEGLRRGARVGENRRQKQVEVRRWQKWSKAMPTEITTEGGKEDSLSSLDFRSFSAQVCHRRITYKHTPGTPQCRIHTTTLPTQPPTHQSHISTRTIIAMATLEGPCSSYSHQR